MRIITSTNRNLEQEVKKTSFRKDLYYRINVIKISVPPLRKRREDIPLLSYHFLRKYSEEFGKIVRGVSPRVMNIFLHHRWEGNVRELENVIERAVAMADDEEIKTTDLPDQFIDMDIDKQVEKPLIPFDEAKRHFEKHYLEVVLERAKGKITKASTFSAIPRQNIYEKIKKYNIDIERFR